MSPDPNLEAELVQAVRKHASALDCVYLFGSQARGDAGLLSDVDVGCVFSDEVAREGRYKIQLELMDRLQRQEGPHTDVVILNDAAPLFQHRTPGWCESGLRRWKNI